MSRVGGNGAWHGLMMIVLRFALCLLFSLSITSTAKHAETEKVSWRVEGEKYIVVVAVYDKFNRREEKVIC